MYKWIIHSYESDISTKSLFWNSEYTELATWLIVIANKFPNLIKESVHIYLLRFTLLYILLHTHTNETNIITKPSLDRYPHSR